VQTQYKITLQNNLFKYTSQYN